MTNLNGGSGELVDHARRMREQLCGELPNGVGNTIDALCDLIERQASNHAELSERVTKLEALAAEMQNGLSKAYGLIRVGGVNHVQMMNARYLISSLIAKARALLTDKGDV